MHGVFDANVEASPRRQATARVTREGEGMADPSPRSTNAVAASPSRVGEPLMPRSPRTRLWPCAAP